MKKITSFLSMRLFPVLGLLAVFSTGSKAQNAYNCSIDSIVYLTPDTLEFSVMIWNTGTSVMKLQTFQMGLEFNYTAMANGGTITSSWVPGSSTQLLPSGFQDLTAQGGNAMGAALVTSGYRQIRLTAKTGVGQSNGIVMPATPTQYCKMRLINTVPFCNTPPNFIWSFNTASGRTKSNLTCNVNGNTTGSILTTQTTGGTPNSAAPAAAYAYTAGPQHFVNGNPVNTCGSVCPTVASTGSTIDPICFGGTGSTTVTLDAAADGTYTVDGGTAVPFANGTSFVISGLSQGTHTIVVTPVNPTGCTALTTTVVIGGPSAPISNVTSATACDTYTWSVNNQTYTSSGTYSNSSTDTNGCTVLDTLNLTINTSTFSTMSATACDTYAWALNNTTYTVTGSYSVSGTNSAGCTQTDSLNLTINASTSSSTSATSCDTYTWALNNSTYTVTGTYSASSTNSAGCPQTDTLNLTINASTSSNTSATVCDTYTWALNNTTYTVTGTYSVSGTNSAGCPQTDTLNLTINASTSSNTSATACDTYTWALNNTTYTVTGTYSVSGTNSAGCPQTDTLNLTITLGSSTSTTATACDTYTWSVNGQTYTTGGTYTATVNCVTTTLNLTINSSSNNTTTVSNCGSYIWPVNGQTYTTSGTFTSTTGCATETLILTITSTQGTITNVATCSSYTWALNGQTYTATGTYTFSTGCAVHTLNLTITPAAVITGVNVTNITGISAHVNWTAVSGVAWYEVRWKPVSSATWTTGTNNTSITKVIVNLIPNTDYVVQVRAFCSSTSAGPWSSPVNFTTNIICAPPTNVVGVSTVGTSAVVSWTNVAGAGFYNLRYRISPAGTWVNVSNVTNPKTLTGLSPNTTYDVQVASGCNGGNAISQWSVQGTFTTAPPCGIPTNLLATNITTTTAKLNWTTVIGATSYSTRYKKVTSSTWITGSSASISKNIATLQPGQNYEFQAKALCVGNVSGAWSGSEFFTTNTIREENDALAEVEENLGIEVYPNPTNGDLNIDFDVVEFTLTNIKVLDMSGRTVKQLQVNAVEGNNKVTMDISDLANGIYTLQITGNNKLMKVTRVNKN